MELFKNRIGPKTSEILKCKKNKKKKKEEILHNGGTESVNVCG